MHLYYIYSSYSTGLLFNKISDSCDYSRNVICNKKSEKATSTTTAKPTTTTLSHPKTDATTSTTTTTTTEIPLEEEYEEEEEDTESQQDPKAIKQLITLIKKLGKIYTSVLCNKTMYYVWVNECSTV